MHAWNNQDYTTLIESPSNTSHPQLRGIIPKWKAFCWISYCHVTTTTFIIMFLELFDRSWVNYSSYEKNIKLNLNIWKLIVNIYHYCTEEKWSLSHSFSITCTTKVDRAMASPLNERSEPESKQAWRGNNLLSVPPPPLLAIVGIVVFLLWVSSQLNNNYLVMQIATTNVNFFLLFLPLVLTLIVQGTRLVPPAPSVRPLHDGDAESESSSIPWGWVVSVLMLLVLTSYRLHPILVVGIVFLYVYLLSA